MTFCPTAKSSVKVTAPLAASLSVATVCAVPTRSIDLSVAPSGSTSLTWTATACPVVPLPSSALTVIA
jgi:hypothetical protein